MDEQPQRRRSGARTVGLIGIGVAIGAVVATLMLSGMAWAGWVALGPSTGAGSNPSVPPVSMTTQPVKDGGVVRVDVQTAITDAANRVMPAVVGVINLQRTSSGNGFSLPGPWGEILPFPFGGGGNNANGNGLQQVGAGTGFVFDRNGYIATNEHVVEGAQKVVIVLPSGEQIDAEVVGSDQPSDLAVLKIPANKVKTVTQWGDSDAVKAGEPAIAIGNPLGLQFQGSVTAGVVSAPKREMTTDQASGYTVEMIQTDAAINFGNSGGPLINAAGNVIGINSQKITEASQGPTEGLGFAITSDFARPLLQQLVQNGKVVRPFLGVSAAPVPLVLQDSRYADHWQYIKVRDGAFVVDVLPNSPAAAAGIKPNDVIVAIGGQTIDMNHSLQAVLWQHQVNEKVGVRVNRQGKSLALTVTLRER
ncbi:MAG: trypsin-like peptidase domain-containing protein [Firmicutes bacterium]|nr:trypsin-like peptidase domain-containing protein [Bacillota bacterium]